MYKVRKVLPAGAWQEISSCGSHIARTMLELGLNPADAIITEADEFMHTCMGCLKGWPA